MAIRALVNKKRGLAFLLCTVCFICLARAVNKMVEQMTISDQTTRWANNSNGGIKYNDFQNTGNNPQAKNAAIAATTPFVSLFST